MPEETSPTLLSQSLLDIDRLIKTPFSELPLVDDPEIWKEDQLTDFGKRLLLKEFTEAVGRQRFNSVPDTGDEMEFFTLSQDVLHDLSRLDDDCVDPHEPGTECAYSRALTNHRAPPDRSYVTGNISETPTLNKLYVQRHESICRLLNKSHITVHYGQTEQTQSPMTRRLIRVKVRGGRICPTGPATTQTQQSGGSSKHRRALFLAGFDLKF